MVVQDALFGDLDSSAGRISNGNESLPAKLPSSEGISDQSLTATIVPAKDSPKDTIVFPGFKRLSNDEGAVKEAPPEEIRRRSSSLLLSTALHLAAKSDGSFGAAYEIIGDAPIARGAFALVWRCRLRKATSGMLYVVKCIDRERLQKVDKKNLFGSDGRDGEIRLHSKIIHPNVVRLISVFEELTVVSVVLERCAGGDLFEHIRAHKKETGGGVGIPAAIACMRQLLRALTFLHTATIVHRDVKSENMMLVEEGLPLEQCTCKLGDFGFAVCLQQVKGGKLYTIMGSPSTVAPEVLQRKSYGAPADLWSAGVVLYNLIAATQPFKAPSPKEIMKKVKTGTFSLEGHVWDAVDENAKDLLRSLMCLAVEKRLRAPQALLHSFLGMPDCLVEAPDHEKAESRSERHARSRGGTGSGVPNRTCNMPPPLHPRSITTESIAENSDCVCPSDTDFKLMDTPHNGSLPGTQERVEQNSRTPPEKSRNPSAATDTTEYGLSRVPSGVTSVHDSEYGLEEWQMSYARRANPAPTSPPASSDVSEASPSKGGNPTRFLYLAAPYAARQSRMTSAGSDTTVADSAFGLSEDQLRRSPAEGALSNEAQRESFNQELLAKHTALEAQKELMDSPCQQNSALDVLGSRLQEAHQPSRGSVDPSACDTDDEAQDDEEEEEDDGEELTPFIYKRRSISDVYRQQFMDQDASGKPRACCGGCSHPSDNSPWWQRWFF